MSSPAWIARVPSGPGRLPGIGHAFALARDPLSYVRRLNGYGPLVHLQCAGLHIAWVNGPEDIHEVLAGEAAQRMGKGRLFTRMTPAVGNGLASRDEGHREVRALVQPAFNREHLVRYAEIMSDRARQLAGSLVPGKPAAMEAVASRYAIGTLAATMFPDSTLGRRAVRDVQRILPVILRTMLMRAVMPPYLTPWTTLRFRWAARTLRRVIDEVNAHTRESTDSVSLTARLMAARDPETGQTLTREGVADEQKTMLFAGTETTGSTLAWALAEIARNPRIEERMVAEIDEVVGDGPVSFDHFRRLPYTQAVVQEALRQHGVVLLMRRAHEPVTIAGVEVPPGTEIGFSLYALHRDPNVYENPDVFDPDRWSKNRRAELPPHAVMPFGAGARKCIGDRFSPLENVITLATLYSRGRFEAVPDRRPPKERLAALAGPRGVHLTWRPYERARQPA
jgi:cytochrome P450